ncbi:MAG: peptidylprolyl isomerase [Desulfobacterales bacterium]|jgi:peptidylprolyl isomerase
MKKAKNGDTVKIHYTGKTEDQKVVTTSKDDRPLEFKIGNSSVPSSLEKGLIGMEVGATKTITVPPDEGFGPKREELVMTLKKGDFPDDVELNIGQRFQFKQTDGKLVDIYIVDIADEVVTIDANHPLAGHNLVFDIEMVDIT